MRERALFLLLILIVGIYAGYFIFKRSFQTHSENKWGWIIFKYINFFALAVIIFNCLSPTFFLKSFGETLIGMSTGTMFILNFIYLFFYNRFIHLSKNQKKMGKRIRKICSCILCFLHFCNTQYINCVPVFYLFYRYI